MLASFRRLRLLLWLLPAGAAAGLMLLAPLFRDSPHWAAAVLVLLGIGGLSSARAPATAIARRHWPLFGIALLIVCGVSLLSFDFFSDDARRHLHDGFYLWRGFDVYSIPPAMFPEAPSGRANHDHFGSVYLPVTQALAMAGAFIAPQYGYLLLATIWLFFFAILAFVAGDGRQRRLIFGLAFAPGMLLIVSARHSDVLGMFAVLAAISLFERRGAASAAAVGAIASLLVGLKPEGLVWAAYFLAQAVSGRAGDDRKTRIVATASLLFPFLTGIGIQLVFARQALFPWELAWHSFLHTLQIFADYFVAYNPVVDWREWALGASRPQSLVSWRLQSVAGFALVVLIVPLLSHAAGRTPDLLALKSLGDEVRQRIQALLPVWLVLAVAALILMRGAWNPWYFCWLLPALALARWTQALRIIGGLLPLFYLPVLYYRAGFGWQMSSFYVVLLVALFLALWLTFIRRRTSFQSVWTRMSLRNFRS